MADFGIWGRLSSRLDTSLDMLLVALCASADPLGGDKLDLGALYFWPGLVGSCPLHVGGDRFCGTVCCEADSQPLAVWLAVAQAGVATSGAVLATTWR